MRRERQAPLLITNAVQRRLHHEMSITQPDSPQVWKFEFKDDHWAISDSGEVGTYMRR